MHVINLPHKEDKAPRGEGRFLGDVVLWLWSSGKEVEFRERGGKCLCPSGKDAKEPRMQIGKGSAWREKGGTLGSR